MNDATKTSNVQLFFNHLMSFNKKPEDDIYIWPINTNFSIGAEYEPSVGSSRFPLFSYQNEDKANPYFSAGNLLLDSFNIFHPVELREFAATPTFLSNRVTKIDFFIKLYTTLSDFMKPCENIFANSKPNYYFVRPFINSHGETEFRHFITFSNYSPIFSAFYYDIELDNNLNITSCNVWDNIFQENINSLTLDEQQKALNFLLFYMTDKSFNELVNTEAKDINLIYLEDYISLMNIYKV